MRECRSQRGDPGAVLRSRGHVRLCGRGLLQCGEPSGPSGHSELSAMTLLYCGTKEWFSVILTHTDFSRNSATRQLRR